MRFGKTEFNVKAVKAMTKTEFMKVHKGLKSKEALEEIYSKITGKK